MKIRLTDAERVRPGRLSVATGMPAVRVERLAVPLLRIRSTHLLVPLDESSVVALRRWRRLLLTGVLAAAFAVGISIWHLIGGVFKTSASGVRAGPFWLPWLIVVATLLLVVFTNRTRPPFYPERVAGQPELLLRRVSLPAAEEWASLNEGRVTIIR
ncbi:hypothetical protein [Micromonospora sp. RP3T]|uniref:hypothetical protein n=1 Tax=Micromonospora sp. RP3T TaxID=2135446 RepID=UPI003D7572C5